MRIINYILKGIVLLGMIAPLLLATVVFFVLQKICAVFAYFLFETIAEEKI